MNIILKAIENLFGGDKPKGHKDAFAGELFHRPTRQKRWGGRHVQYTKNKNNGESKKRRKMAAKSRRINWKQK